MLDNFTLLAAIVRGPGNYLNWFKLVPIVAVYLSWVYTTNWVERDSQEWRVRYEVWHPTVFFPGLVGLFLAWVIPLYVLQVLVVVLAWALPLGMYIHHRNQRVPEEQMVTTASVITAALAKVGIELGGGEEEEQAEGPPIKFMMTEVGPTKQQQRLAQAEQSAGFLPAKELIYDAALRRATDVLLEPKKDRYMVRYRIDGMLHAAEPFDRPTGMAVIEAIKVLAGANPAERRKPQSGRFQAETQGKQLELRAATQGTMAGERFSLRIISDSDIVSRLADLGMREKMVQQLTELIKQPHGLIMIAGPRGVGKTTTLHAALREIDRFTRNVFTLEKEIDFQIDNVLHNKISRDPDKPLVLQLRTLLRQVPDVVMISELTDPDTAEMACEAAAEDRLILSTITANDAVSGLFRFLEVGVDRGLIARALLAFLSQRLVRKLCQHCKEPYRPKPEFLKKANLPAAKIEAFYRPPRNPEEPCQVCGGTGYFGRTGIFEMLVVNDRIRELIAAGPSRSAVKAEARKNGMFYLQEDGLRQVIRGVTSVEELMRAFK